MNRPAAPRPPKAATAEGRELHMPTVSPRAVDRLDAAQGRFADPTKRWHRRARERHPQWPSVPSEAYLALAGATAGLVRSRVRVDRTDAVPELEETLVS